MRRTAGTLLSAMLQDAVATLFPADCRLCAQPLVDRVRLPVCVTCLAEPRAQTGLLCALCGERLEADFEADRFRSPQQTQGTLCGVCRSVPPPFAQAVAFGEYEGALRELLHLLKYDGLSALAQPLGEWLATSFASLGGSFAEEPGQEWLVVPVPLARKKRRARGANQAELLATAAVAAWMRLPRSGAILRPAFSVLQRTRETESQFGLTPHQRRLNLRGSFAVAEGAEIRGRRVLLLDDIFTTGATARACSAALRRTGAAEVRVATLARTQRSPVVTWDGEMSAVAVFRGTDVPVGV